MNVYDNYEISPCTRTEEPGSPGTYYFEVCDPDEADVWTLYGHIKGEGVEAIGDFSTREAAEQVYFRITGMSFTGSCQVARLRVMHAAPALLNACRLVVERWERGDLAEAARACRDAVAEATGRIPPEPREPIVIEVRGGVVQEVSNVPPGYEYVVKDYDDLDESPTGDEKRSVVNVND